MSLATALEALDEAIATAEPDELQALTIGLAARLAMVAARMGTAPAAPRWLTVDEAADLAQVPTARIRSWARRSGAEAWATRPTRKTLRISEGAFRAWLKPDTPLSTRINANRTNAGQHQASIAPIRSVSTVSATRGEMTRVRG